MSMVAKILVFVNLVLAVLVMGAAGAYIQSAEDWRTQYKSKDEQEKREAAEHAASITQANGSRDEANRKALAAETRAAQAEGQSRTLAEGNKTLQDALSKYNATLAQFEARMKDLEGNLATSQQQNTTLQGEAKRADDEKRTALAAQSAAETEQKRLEKQVATLSSDLDDSAKNKNMIAEQLDASNTALAAYKEKFGTINWTGAPVKGVVLASDAKTDIYLISIGSKDGLKMADKLTVFRNDKFIANVVVDKVMADKASVVVERVGGKAMKAAGMEIMQGDKVATIY